MAGTRQDHRFHHGLLLCLPLLTLLLLSLPLGPARASDENQTTPVTRELTLNYLSRTLEAIADVMSFYQSQHTKVNLDGIIGMRMVQATLKVLLRNLEVRHQMSLLPGELVVDMRSLHNLTKRVADMTEPHVAHRQKRYYNRMWPTVSDGQWELNYPTRSLSTSLRTWEYDELEMMRENQSDDCVEELFGTDNDVSEPCVITDGCWVNMTQMGYHRYSLTHEIFYLQLGELSGCMYHMLVKLENSNGSQPSLQFLQETFCLNILKEAKYLANQSYPTNSRDLFMEQAGLCGLYGFWEFFRYSWLDKILSWQDKEAGCYKNKNWPEYIKHMKKPKREEVRLDRGCLTHLTAVAVAALVQYVRHLTESLLPQNNSVHPLVSSPGSRLPCGCRSGNYFFFLSSFIYLFIHLSAHVCSKHSESM